MKHIKSPITLLQFGIWKHILNTLKAFIIISVLQFHINSIFLWVSLLISLLHTALDTKRVFPQTSVLPANHSATSSKYSASCSLNIPPRCEYCSATAWERAPNSNPLQKWNFRKVHFKKRYFFAYERKPVSPLRIKWSILQLSTWSGAKNSDVAALLVQYVVC